MTSSRHWGSTLAPDVPMRSPGDLWCEWVHDELLRWTRSQSLQGAYLTAAERSGDAVIADPFVWAEGGMFGTAVLAQEALARTGRDDVELTALAAAILLDPHGRVGPAVERARREADFRRHFWTGDASRLQGLLDHRQALLGRSG